MKKYSCLIVDDEPLARKVLEQYVAMTDSLVLLRSTADVYEVLRILESETVDILLLDIKMPALSGFQLLQKLSLPPKVILTTAYNEYALKAFDIGVVDYLMKPIAYDRFMKAIGRATNTIIEEDSSEKVNFANQFLFFKVGGNFQRIMLKNISYLEAFGNYTKLYEGNNMILISEGISGVYQKLPQEYFVRIHKSYVVNLSAIATVQTQHIIVNNRFLPLGETFKQSFHTAWGKFI